MTTKRITKRQQKRLQVATDNFQEIQKRLVPFIKPMRIEDISTKGHWEKSTDLTNVFASEDFHEALKKAARPVQAQAAQEKQRPWAFHHHDGYSEKHTHSDRLVDTLD